MTSSCSYCGRKLLSHASALCNWCGAAIDDAAYQAEAQRERAAFFQHQAQHDAQSLANVEGIAVAVPLASQLPAPPIGQPAPFAALTSVCSVVLPRFGTPLAAAPSDAPPSSADAAEDGTHARFEHLEV